MPELSIRHCSLSLEKHPNWNDIYYEIYWGDCEEIFHAGPYKSREKVKFFHDWCEIYSKTEEYTIRVQASDNNGLKSDWGTLNVLITGKSKSKPYINNLFLQVLENHPYLFTLLRILL